MDLKEPGNCLYLVGLTKNELGGSHFALVEGLEGGQVPRVDAAAAKDVFAAIHQAVDAGLVRACHDLSEGGLAASVAEMAFAGGLGAEIDLGSVPCSEDAAEAAVLLFSESNTRFLLEVRPENAEPFEALMLKAGTARQGVAHKRIGRVLDDGMLRISDADGAPVVQADLKSLKEAWQKPLRW
jgi:phosphoribosylformylglycinamidine synthase